MSEGCSEKRRDRETQGNRNHQDDELENKTETQIGTFVEFPQDFLEDISEDQDNKDHRHRENGGDKTCLAM